MEAIENAAFISVGRACGFVGLAVFCIVFGLMYDPVFAARAGDDPADARGPTLLGMSRAIRIDPCHVADVPEDTWPCSPNRIEHVVHPAPGSQQCS